MCINSPGTSLNPKISNNQNIFFTPNRYCSLSVEDNINNANNIDAEIENDDIIINAPPHIFIKLIINNYQQIFSKTFNLTCVLIIENRNLRILMTRK